MFVITPAMVGQVVISGLLAGALYAMVALGLGLIFGVMRVLNVAHGPLLMLGAYTTFWLFHWFGLNPYLSLLVSMPALFLVGVVLQSVLVRRVVDAPELSSLLLTFGISIALVNVAQLAFTTVPQFLSCAIGLSCRNAIMRLADQRRTRYVQITATGI
jgi:branched-chain amino acid transport system permease protein